jgi:hypothetical protein
MWCDLVLNFKKYFGRSSAAGSPKSLRRDLADAMDCKFFKASQNADSKVTQRANKMGQNGRWHFLQLAFRLGISHQRVFYGNDF